MNNNNQLNTMLQAALKVTEDREWNKYHTPKNMAMDLVREASEVLEHFLWVSDQQIKQDQQRIAKISDEMGDVLHALLLLADTLNIDLTQSFWQKLEKVKKRYPAEQIKGTCGYDFKNSQK